MKELYQGVLGKLQPLHRCLYTEERQGEEGERIRRDVEREVVRRKTLASQLRTLLDSQIQVNIDPYSPEACGYFASSLYTNNMYHFSLPCKGCY